MARFSGTSNRDIFDGLLNEDNLFVFRPAYLSATDHVFGSTNLNVVDTLAFTTAARVQAGKFDDTRNIEVIRLDVAGIDLTVSQQLAGSSQRGFLTISGSEGADIVSGQPTDLSRGPVTTPLVFNTNGGADRFTGGEGNDTVRIGDEDSTGIVLDGRGGNDTLYYWGTGTFDSATLGSVTGFETVEIASRNGAAGNAVLRDNLFGPGQTTLDVVARVPSTIDASGIGAGKTLDVTLTSGSDTYTGGAGNDIVDGGSGDDTFTGGFGNNIFNGSEGYDTAIFDFSNLTVTLNFNQFNAGFTLSSGNTDLGLVTALDNVEELRITGGTGNDLINTRNTIERTILDGGNGNDNLSVNGVNDRVFGGLGDDRLVGTGRLGEIRGGEGNDLIEVRGESTSLATGNNAYGEAGNDTLYTIGRHDNLFGGDGDDLLYNFTFSSLRMLAVGSLNGDAGNDRFYIFDNTSISGLGFASLNGGTGGDDVFIAVRSSFDLRSVVANGNLVEIERFIFDNATGNTLTLDNDTVASISSERSARLTASPVDDSFIIQGDANDTVSLRSTEIGGFWSEVQSNVGLDGAAGGGFDFWAYVEGGQTTAFLAVDSDIRVLTPAFAFADAPLGAEAFEAAGAGLGGGFDLLEGIPHLA